MQTLIAPTEQFIFIEKTTLTADINAGATVLLCENTIGFANGQYVMIGYLGFDTTELLQIASISSNNITLTSAIKSKHLSGAPVTRVFYNQRKFYRSTSQNGVFTHLLAEGSPVDLDIDDPAGTRFEDSSGTSTSWYKATYYNIYFAQESDINDAVAAQVSGESAYTSLYKIRSEAGFTNNDFISINLVSRYRDEAQMEIDGTLALTYSTPFVSIPKLITHITTLLAAGFLLAKEYGVEADVEISKTGQRKIDRAEELLKKINNGEILLVAPDGSQLRKKSSILASGSNAYDSNNPEKGRLFNIADENFKFTNPADPTASSDRISVVSLRTRQWSQK